MRNILNNRLRTFFFVIGVVVDIYGLIQIIRLNQFKMPLLVSSPWFWLCVLVTVVMVCLFLYFKWQDFKKNTQAEIKLFQDDFASYRERVREEFIRCYDLINSQQEQLNKLNWKLEEIHEKSIKNDS